MANDINKQIEQHIQTFVAELSELVRAAAMSAVSDALTGGKPVRATSAAAKPASKPAAKPAAKAAPAAPAAKPAKGGKGTRIRRTPEQIAAAVGKVYSYIKANPNQRTEKIRAALGIDQATMRDALDRLGGSKKIKMKGVKRAATYTAV